MCGKSVALVEQLDVPWGDICPALIWSPSDCCRQRFGPGDSVGAQECLSLSQLKSDLVGGFKHVLFFHSVWNVIIPTDDVIFFAEGEVNHQPVIVSHGQWAM